MAELNTEGWHRCGCSRLVPPEEWAGYPHECCNDCYWAADSDWRLAIIEGDQERLIDETRD